MSKLSWIATLATACAALTSGLLFAQPKDEFKITSFIPEKFTDLEWRITGDAGLNGSRTHEDQSLSSLSGTRENRRVSYLSTSSNVGSYTYYRYVTPNRSIVASMNCGGQLSYYRNDQRDTVVEPDHTHAWIRETRNPTYRVMIMPTADVSQYLTSDLFASLRCGLSYSYSRTPNSTSNMTQFERNRDTSGWITEYTAISHSKTDATNRTTLFEVRLLAGFGRIYSGSYAATALYLIDELSRHQILMRSLSYDESMALTEIVYHNRLKHAVDSRIRRIEIFQEILNYLQRREITSDSTLTPLVLQDVWDYFPRDSRDFGWQVRIGLGYFKFIYPSSESTEEESIEHTVVRFHEDSVSVREVIRVRDYAFSYARQKRSYDQPYLAFGLNFARPLNLFWQMSGGLQGRYYFDAEDLNRSVYLSYSGGSYGETELKKKYDDYYDLSASATASCFMSSRSQFSMSVGGSYRHLVVVESLRKLPSGELVRDIERQTQHEFNATARTQFTYRLTIPTELTASAEISTYDTKIEVPDYGSDADNLYYKVTIQLSHYIY